VICVHEARNEHDVVRAVEGNVEPAGSNEGKPFAHVRGRSGSRAMSAERPVERRDGRFGLARAIAMPTPSWLLVGAALSSAPNTLSGSYVRLARDETAGSRTSELLRLPVKLVPRHASLHTCRPTGGIDEDAFHRREVDDQTVVAHRSGANVVAAPADSDLERVGAPVTGGGDHVVNSGAAGDHRRPLVDHPVPNGPGSVVALVARSNELAAKCSSNRDAATVPLT